MKEILMLVLTIGICNGVNRKLVATIDRHELCDKQSNAFIAFSETVITTINHRSYLSATIEIFEDIEELNIFSVVTRCDNKENLNTCQFFGKYPLYDSCSIIARNDTMFSTINYNYSPPFICPLKKGVYKLRNGYINTGYQIFPVEGYYWKIKQNYFNKKNDNLLFTLCLEGQFFSVI